MNEKDAEMARRLSGYGSQFKYPLEDFTDKYKDVLDEATVDFLIKTGDPNAHDVYKHFSGTYSLAWCQQFMEDFERVGTLR